MPRRARLDAPGTLRHVIVRGIEGRHLVDYDRDRRDFVSPMSTVAVESASSVYAGALMTNQIEVRKPAPESRDGQASTSKRSR